MILLEDTRQQAGKHKNLDSYFKRTGVQVERCALYVGDYAFANDMRRAVDTKSGVMELMMDMHQDHERFAAECERAQRAGIGLLILIEEVLPEGGLAAWVAPKNRFGQSLTKASPETLRRALHTMTAKYGVRFRFCSPNSTGRHIIEYLTEGVLPP